jgi:flagellar hook-associated protein 3 FlgL
MRISSNQIFQSGLTSILDSQRKVNNTQQQVATGQRILRPSDDPFGTVQSIEINRQMTLANQFQDNMNRAEELLTLEETALDQMINLLHNFRDLTMRSTTDVLNPANRAQVADELEQYLAQIGDMMNTRDSTGEFIFSGFKSKTPPFTRQEDGSYLYNLEDLTFPNENDPSRAQRSVRIGEFTEVQINDTARDLFVDVPLSAPSRAASGEESRDMMTTLHNVVRSLKGDETMPLSGNEVLDIQSAFEHLNDRRSYVGTRLNAIENQRIVNEDFQLRGEQTLSDIASIDMAEAIARLTQQMNGLQVMHQTYGKIQSLSLFNYIN